MRHIEEEFKAADGRQMFRQEWWPESDPRAVVCLVHGLGEHSGRYDNVVRALTDDGLAVFAIDLRGHGRSSGTRGDIRIDEVVEDIDELIAFAQQRSPKVPVILYGHSLGGLLSMTYVVRKNPDIAAQVVTSPALDTQLREQKLKMALANVLGGILPGITLPTGGSAEGISRDPEVVAAYENDPLVHDKASFALAKQSLQAMDVLEELEKYPLPLLLIQGTADAWVIPAATKRFADATEGDVTLYEYEGLFHEPHHEPEKEQVLGDILTWIDARIAS